MRPKNISRVGVLLVLAGLIVFVLVPGAGSGVKSSFGLSGADERIQFDSLRIPSSPALWILASFIVLMAVSVATAKTLRRNSTSFVGGLSLFVPAVMVWATAGKEFSLVSMLAATVASATPIALGALGGILCERSGVVNIGIEGILLGSAFSGVVVGSLLGSWPGLAAAVLTGGALASLLAWLSLRFGVDQIIVGVVLNILVLGLTSFLSAQVLVKNPGLNDAPIFRSVPLPLLSDIPLLGRMFFNQTVIVYGAFILVGVTSYFLRRTAWGLRTRSVGENPLAADTLGLDVLKIRYRAVLLGGMVGGFGGAWFTIGTVGRFDEGMTAGRGFIGLAAMIFGAWSPWGALGASLVFGFFYSLQQKFAVLGTPIPGEFLAMTPYLVTIFVVAGVVGAVRPPAAAGQTYDKEGA